MSIPNQIERTKIFQSREPFGPIRMSKELGITRKSCRDALNYMANEGRVDRAGNGLFVKPIPKHWIHTAPLNDKKRIDDAKALHAARVLV